MAKKIRLADTEHRQLVSIAESLFRLANSVQAIESIARAEFTHNAQRRREEERRERDLTLGQWIKFAPAMRAMVNDIVKAHPGWRLATVEETRLKLKDEGVTEWTYHAANDGKFPELKEDLLTVRCLGWLMEALDDHKTIAPFYAKREG